MAIHYLSKAGRKAIAGVAVLRLDFNTKDDWRMKAVLPTIKFLLKHPCKIVVISHRGRPEGVKTRNGVPSGFKRDLSLRKDATMLTRLAGRRVVFVPHFRFAEIRRTIVAAPAGSIFLLENLRFMPEEEKDSPVFARGLASLGDFYVNDAFAVSHRANASVAAITKFLPSYAGLELEKEIASLGKAMKPKRPLVLILGGAKAADKLGVIAYFREKADWFLLGGGPANTILWLRGMDVKRSVRDKDPKDLAALRRVAGWKSVVLPHDFVWQNGAMLDIGAASVADFKKKIAAARTIIWSGPLGLIERPRFARGSVGVAQAVIGNRRAFSVTGGGETVMFLKKYRLDRRFGFISTGGGAMVDFLAGKKLPGIEALR